MSRLACCAITHREADLVERITEYGQLGSGGCDVCVPESYFASFSESDSCSFLRGTLRNVRQQQRGHLDMLNQLRWTETETYSPSRSIEALSNGVKADQV